MGLLENDEERNYEVLFTNTRYKGKYCTYKLYLPKPGSQHL